MFNFLTGLFTNKPVPTKANILKDHRKNNSFKNADQWYTATFKQCDRITAKDISIIMDEPEVKAGALQISDMILSSHFTLINNINPQDNETFKFIEEFIEENHSIFISWAIQSVFKGRQILELDYDVSVPLNQISIPQSIRTIPESWVYIDDLNRNKIYLENIIG